MFPALSGPPRCRWSRCRHMCIQGLKGAAAPIITTRLRALSITHHTQIPMQPAAPSPTHIRFPVHLVLPTVCRHTTRWRTSCGRLNPVAGAVCRAMIGCFRHCRQHDLERGAVGQSHPFYSGILWRTEWIRKGMSVSQADSGRPCRVVNFDFIIR